MEERAAAIAVEGEGAWCFGPFALDLANRELRREGAPVALGSRYFDALVLLAGNAGELVTKDRFMDEVWRGIPVTDEALTQCIRTIRRALGDEAGAPRYVATVPKHGYRFLAEVRRPEVRESLRETDEQVTPAPGVVSAGRIAGATTAGGGMAGVLGGLFYGLAGTSGGGMPVMVMVALVSALGVLAGAGVGTGIGLARQLWPHGALPPIGGAALGGMLVGAFGQTLGRDGIAALTGARVGEITGLFEGAVFGLAAGFAAAIALGRCRSARSAIMLSALVGAVAGGVVALSGGSLLGASLVVMEARFPGSDLALGRVGRLFAETGYGPVSRLATSLLEGAVFAACIAAALAHGARLPKRKGRHFRAALS